MPLINTKTAKPGDRVQHDRVAFVGYIARIANRSPAEGTAQGTPHAYVAWMDGTATWVPLNTLFDA